MTRRALLMAAVAGLLVAADPTKDQPAKPAEEKAYAKVELKGELKNASLTDVPGPVLEVEGDRYWLELSQRPNLRGEALRKLYGKTVIVTGTLRLPDGGVNWMPQVLVSSLRVSGNR